MSGIRLLHYDEIECRIGTISEKGLSLLLYTDARAAMKILDETFGCLNWQRSHQMIGNSLYCTVSVWDNEKQQWISKSLIRSIFRRRAKRFLRMTSFTSAIYRITTIVRLSY